MICLYTMVFLVCVNNCINWSETVERNNENDIEDILKAILNLDRNETFNEYPPKSLINFRKSLKKKNRNDVDNYVKDSLDTYFNIKAKHHNIEAPLKPFSSNADKFDDDKLEYILSTENNTLLRTLVQDASKENVKPKETMQDRQKRLKFCFVGEEPEQEICKRKRNKLGKKLALKSSLRKYRPHKRRYGKKICKYKSENKTCCSAYKRLHNVNYSDNSLDPQENQRSKRFNNFGVSFSINIPEPKHFPENKNNFYIEKYNTPHEVMVNRDNSAFSIRVKNFKNMQLKLANDNGFHLETGYSNLRNVNNHHVVNALNQLKHCREMLTTPQYCLKFRYDTDEKETKVKISSLDQASTTIKSISNNVTKSENKIEKISTTTEKTTQRPFFKMETTTTKKSKDSKPPELAKSRINIIKEEKKDFDKKYASYTLVSCLGIHADSDCFNYFKPLRQIAL